MSDESGVECLETTYDMFIASMDGEQSEALKFAAAANNLLEAASRFGFRTRQESIDAA